MLPATAHVSLYMLSLTRTQRTMIVVANGVVCSKSRVGAADTAMLSNGLIYVLPNSGIVSWRAYAHLWVGKGHKLPT
jgi:hypothetical protein